MGSGSCGFAATLMVVCLLALALLPAPAVAARVLLGEEKPSSSEGAPAPTAAAGGSEKQNPTTNKQQHEPPRPATAPKDSPPPPSGVAEDKGKEGDKAQVSAQPVPPNDGNKGVPPPGGPEPTAGETGQGGSSTSPTDQRKDEVENCVHPVDSCSVEGKFSACLQVSKDASIGATVVVLNEGQNDISVNVKLTKGISIDEKVLPLNIAKGTRGKVNINYTKPNGGEITVIVGNEQCVLHISQPVSDWQQQFQQFASYATSVNPIYGAYFFLFTVVLVAAMCACCKFAKRRRDAGVPYQQLEMGAQPPNSSGVSNTTSTADGWEDGWDDDWDDEEAPAKPSDRKPAGSVSTNGLSLQTNNKDGWDVDWDD